MAVSNSLNENRLTTFGLDFINNHKIYLNTFERSYIRLKDLISEYNLTVTYMGLGYYGGSKIQDGNYKISLRSKDENMDNFKIIEIIKEKYNVYTLDFLIDLEYIF